jgi:peptidyl-prolyl cis-trans isomerase D
MFNLFRSQKQMVRLLLGGIMLLVALSMVITLVPGLYSDAAPTANNYVFATVGDKELTLQEVQIRFRDLQIGAENDPQTLRITALNTIDSMIMEKALLQEAEDLGLTPDEKEVAEWLRMQLPFLFPNGVFVGPEQYAMFVRQRFQRSIPEFEAEVSRSLAIDTRLRRLVASTAIVTESEVRNTYRRQNEKTKVEFVKIAAQELANTISPSDDQLTEYFTKNQARYGIPELRTLKIMYVDASSLPTPEVADSEIDQYYGRNRSLYEMPERVRASHILFMTQGKSEEETTKIKGQAEEVLKQVRAGGDFAQLAEKYSEDPVSAKQGGDLGWVTRGQMVPEFEATTFSTAPGQISDLVKTDFGFHIIRSLRRSEHACGPLRRCATRFAPPSSPRSRISIA